MSAVSAYAYLVTGTGTDIGKTYVTVRLIEALRASGRRVDALKPILSGFLPSSAQDSDSAKLLNALGRPPSLDEIKQITPWRFEAPLSPDMAAARAGASIDFEAVCSFVRERIRATEADILFVEGAGGVLSPVSRDHSVRDLGLLLSMPFLLVAGSYLGTISHTLSACEAITHRGGRVAAIVLSESLESPVPPEETAQSIARLHSAPVFIVRRNGDAPRSLILELLRA